GARRQAGDGADLRAGGEGRGRTRTRDARRSRADGCPAASVSGAHRAPRARRAGADPGGRGGHAHGAGAPGRGPDEAPSVGWGQATPPPPAAPPPAAAAAAIPELAVDYDFEPAVRPQPAPPP